MGKTGNDKLIILGFDGASPDLLEKWINEGHLPNLEALIDNGVYGSLKSVPNMSSPPAWTSLATGRNPGKHGIFRFTERNFNSYSYSYVNGGCRKAETFWDILCGERTGCIINMPMTYPVQPINGCMISGLDAPGIDSRGASYPDTLLKELNVSSAPYEIAPAFGHLLRNGGHFGDVAKLFLSSIDMRYEYVCALTKKYDWDLLAVVFSETDLAHHFFWKFIDPQHPDYSEREAKEYGDSILKVYKKLDEVTGKLLNKNPDVTVLIVSDHGGGVNTRGGELVNDWLESIGMLKREKTSFNPSKVFNRLYSGLAKAGYKTATKHLSKDAKLKLTRWIPAVRGNIESAVRLGGIDWERTKAFCDGKQDDIWINLKGRDSMGAALESEYDEICNFICSELKDAVDVLNNKKIIDSVFRREDVYEGPYIDKAADISVNWKPDAVIHGIRTKSSPNNIKPVKWEWPYEIATGGHSLNGIFIAHGQELKNGYRINDAQIMDIMPTILYHFDEEIPDDVDGKVLENIFDKDYLRANPPRFKSSEKDIKAGADVYSEEDASVIEQRLKDLGYI